MRLTELAESVKFDEVRRGAATEIIGQFSGPKRLALNSLVHSVKSPSDNQEILVGQMTLFKAIIQNTVLIVPLPRGASMIFRSNKIPQVYTSGKATRLLEGTSMQSAWEMYTVAFQVENNDYLQSKSFVYGGYPLEEKVSGFKDSIQVKDIFKSITSHNNEFYTEIVKWNLPKGFAFIEYSWKEGTTGPSKLDRTDFAFFSHPEGTVVEIIRREKGLLREARDCNGGKKLIGANAAGRLGYIIGRSDEGFVLQDSQSFVIEGYTVSRIDDLQTEFSDTPMSG